MKALLCIVSIGVAALLLTAGAAAPKQRGTAPRPSACYVPVYSAVHYGDRQHAMNLAVTLAIHNTDLRNAIMITAVDFYDTAGRKLKSYLATPRALNPLETVQYYVRESDTSGGTGANFIVRWRAASGAGAPLVESIMIGTHGQQGISFTSRCVPIPD
ncbi:MAG TPA: DUF3124 domain-containing protein [Spirochaetota bacterium]|nr:DUF3124 domain-containing protein [Spirochaetota bacterium]HNT11165.1 DUF3124 domain-containing protein [Spirochaetota bacterium]HNV46080.1 DUF3124 domain-containing protein [Spirochaetota bacterium]HOS41458.1 DUF3124 domain-containing protein [Spirochaetota bacterium]HPI24191.1 DUF3124 domain-containing protein [Spirochaetota bacterium]